MTTLRRTACRIFSIILAGGSAVVAADPLGTRVPVIGGGGPVVTDHKPLTMTPATAVLPSQPSGPVDRKTYPGSFCKPDYGRDGDQVNYSAGAIKTRDDGYAVVVCPIVRDNTVNTDGASVTLYVDSRDDLVACTLFSRSAYGEELSRHTRTADDWGKTSIEFQVSVSEDSSYLSLLCNLESRNRIFSYTVSEFTDTTID